jgi:peptidoglycan/LPS O-acetylase OafA/YrhL
MLLLRKMEPMPNMPAPKRAFYRPELDVLRFGAFLLVFLCHIDPVDSPAVHSQSLRTILTAFDGCAYGVDVFFSLSSYLITTLLFKEFDLSATIDVRAFYIRRILRIWPLYFTFLLFIIPAIGLAFPYERLSTRYLIPFITLSGNWACAAWGFPLSGAGVLWSVSIEEQFYLSWPLIMKRYLSKLGTICFALICVSILTRFLLVYLGASRDAIFCNTLARLDPIAAGALVALAFKQRVPHTTPIRRVAMITTGLALIAGCGILGSGAGPRALATYPVATVAAVLLLLGMLGADFSTLPRLLIQPLVYLGRISYGLYVFHAVFIGIVSTVMMRSAGVEHHSLLSYGLRVSLSMIFTVCAAALSYRFLEHPFLLLKAKQAYIATER